MKDLKLASDGELQTALHNLKAELQIREAARMKVEQERKQNMACLVLRHIDALLELVPQHGPTSCSDEDPRNANRPCTRCQLLDAKEMGFSNWMVEHLELQKVP